MGRPSNLINTKAVNKAIEIPKTMVFRQQVSRVPKEERMVTNNVESARPPHGIKKAKTSMEPRTKTIGLQ